MHSDILFLIVPYIHISDALNLILHIDDYTWKMLLVRDYPSMYIDPTLTYMHNYIKLHKFFKVLLYLQQYVFADAANALYQICSTEFMLKKMHKFMLVENKYPEVTIDIVSLYHVYSVLMDIKEVYDELQSGELSYNVDPTTFNCVIDLFTDDDLKVITDRMEKLGITDSLSMYSTAEMIQFAADMNAITCKQQYKQRLEADIRAPTLCYYRKDKYTMHKLVACSLHNSTKHEISAWSINQIVGKDTLNINHYQELRDISWTSIYTLICRAIDLMK